MPIDTPFELLSARNTIATLADQRSRLISGPMDRARRRDLARVDLDAPARQQRAVWAQARTDSPVNRTLAFDWRYTLAENDLPKVCGTTRLAGVEVGFPLLDNRLLDFSLALPAKYKLKGLKLRINPTPVYRDFYQMLGAAPTPIPTPAVFDAMSNGQVDGLEADIEFSWNQRFDKVAKSLLQMNALFMPFAPLVSGRIWQGLDAKDKDLIRRLVAQSLDAQINDIVTTEAGLIEKFKATPIAFHTAADFKPDGLIAEFDKLWLPKAPQIAELRKVGASL